MVSLAVFAPEPAASTPVDVADIVNFLLVVVNDSLIALSIQKVLDKGSEKKVQ